MLTDLDKFEIANRIAKLREELENPETTAAFLSWKLNVSSEIRDMPTDKDGGVPPFYISESLDEFYRIYEVMNNHRESNREVVNDFEPPNFNDLVFERKYGKR